MGYTPKMRMMIYINTLPFASLSLHSKYLINWWIQIKSYQNSLLWSIELNIIVTNRIWPKEYVMFNTLLSAPVKCLFSFLKDMSVGWWEKQF